MGQIRKFKNEVGITNDHFRVMVNGNIFTFDHTEMADHFAVLMSRLCNPKECKERLAKLNGQGNK